MNYTVHITCVMKVNRNCELCTQKVTHVMHCINVVYSVDFTGENNTMKVTGRANPNVLLQVLNSYGEHGKIDKLSIDASEVMNFRGNEYYGQSGFYLPSNSAGYYPPLPPHGYPGNHGYPTTYPTYPPHMSNGMPEPPKLPARPLYSYHYVEPPYPPSGGKCVIM